MTTDTLDYAAYVDTAMRGVVREILRRVERTGLPGQHHFFISLRTEYPGVVMSATLRGKYPQEITIVLQHQYWDLRVSQDSFQVSLSFNNIPEKLTVPFAALTGFADPSTKFGLQFHTETSAAAPQEMTSGSVITALSSVNPPAAEEPGSGAKILTLDAFRKK